MNELEQVTAELKRQIALRESDKRELMRVIDEQRQQIVELERSLTKVDAIRLFRELTKVMETATRAVASKDDDRLRVMVVERQDFVGLSGWTPRTKHQETGARRLLAQAVVDARRIVLEGLKSDPHRIYEHIMSSCTPDERRELQEALR